MKTLDYELLPLIPKNFIFTEIMQYHRNNDKSNQFINKYNIYLSLDWIENMKYTPEVNGRFSIIDKNGGLLATIEAERDYMITHNFGAYEIDNNTIIFDAITWDSADAYMYWTYIKRMIEDAPGPSNNITRFTIHLDTNTVDMELLHPQPEGTWIEFTQINWQYADENQYYR